MQQGRAGQLRCSEIRVVRRWRWRVREAGWARLLFIQKYRRPFAFADAADLWEYRHSWDHGEVRRALRASFHVCSWDHHASGRSSCGYIRKTSRGCQMLTCTANNSWTVFSARALSGFAQTRCAASGMISTSSIGHGSESGILGLGGGGACLEPVVSVNLQYCRVSVWGCHNHRPGLAVWIQRLPSSKILLESESWNRLLAPWYLRVDTQLRWSRQSTPRSSTFCTQNLISSFGQLEEIMLPKAIDYFCKNEKATTIYQMLWRV